jgi:sulfatase maturation enzyme AslB (radical SAM superfamily)
MSDDQKGDEVKLLEGKYQSQYFESSKDLLQGLNNVSPSFCLAKWYNVSIHIPTGRTHSCYHPPSHKIPLEELNQSVAALHNTKHKSEQRKKMLSGERPKECEFCWAIEDQGNISDRAYRSFDVYEPGLIGAAQVEENPKPKYLEVNFNQACNLKCAYCSPHLSTEWHKEVKIHGAYELDGYKHNDPRWVDSLGINNASDNPYVQAFWEYFPDVYFTLKTFRLTGGEPLMDKNTFRVFDYVKQNPHKNLRLSITSNCCPPRDQWSKFMSSLKEITDADSIDHFMLYCSLDSWGEQAEYIRNGLKFNTLYKNITQYLQQLEKHSLTFIVTANLLSLPNWLEYIKQIHLLRQTYNSNRQLIWFDTPMLHDPKWMSMKLATPGMLQPLLDSIEYMEANRETTKNRFKGFKDYEVDKVRRLYEWACVPLNTNEELAAKKNFDLFFKQHDIRRNTNIQKTFPQLKTFIEECRIINGQR